MFHFPLNYVFKGPAKNTLIKEEQDTIKGIATKELLLNLKKGTNNKIYIHTPSNGQNIRVYSGDSRSTLKKISSFSKKILNSESDLEAINLFNILTYAIITKEHLSENKFGEIFPIQRLDEIFYSRAIFGGKKVSQAEPFIRDFYKNAIKCFKLQHPDWARDFLFGSFESKIDMFCDMNSLGILFVANTLIDTSNPNTSYEEFLSVLEKKYNDDLRAGTLQMKVFSQL